VTLNLGIASSSSSYSQREIGFSSKLAVEHELNFAVLRSLSCIALKKGTL